MAISRTMRSALVALSASAVSAENGVRVITDANEAPATLPPYDCHAEYDVWKTAWTPDWKEWCCQNEQRGCPSTTTATTTSATVTSTSTTKTTATTTSTLTTTVTTTTTEGEGCAALCEFKFVNATCLSRVHWAATYATNNETNACKAAHTLVLSQCSICGDCSLEAVDCHGSTGKRAEDEPERAEDKPERAEDKPERAEDKPKHAADDDKPERAEEDKQERAEEDKQEPAEDESEPAEDEPERAEDDKPKEEATFGKKFEQPAAPRSTALGGSAGGATSAPHAAGGLGFFARCSLAGVAAGVPLAFAVRRSIRAASARPELGEQIYQQAGGRGDEEEAHE